MALLLFGPGERLTDLMNVVSAARPGASVRQMDDLDELAEPQVQSREGGGVLLIDADELPPEDVGYLRRFLTRHEDFGMTLVGEDSSRRVARTLLRRPRVRWMHWPPDLEDVRGLAAPPDGRIRASAGAAPERRAPAAEVAAHPREPSATPRPAEPRPTEQRSGGGGELAEIEAILDLPSEPEPSPAPQPAPRPEPRPGAPAAGLHAAAGVGTAVAAVLPSYFRDQVADLADIAQRIEGGLESARESGDVQGQAAEGLAGDVGRLLQFTRTLSYLAGTAPRGDQVFDLSELLDTLADTLPRKAPDSPRWLVRSNGPLQVRSDREVLLQAFDALFHVAERCAGRGEIVRVQAAAAQEESAGKARVAIEFPAGPLADVDPGRILEPYALRRVLPDLGPNALSAAAGIVAGQGGSLLLRRGQGRLGFQVELPLAPGR